MNIYTQKQLEQMTDRQLDAICAVYNGYGEDWVERHPDLVPNYCNTWLCCGELIDDVNYKYYLTLECNCANIDAGMRRFEAKHSNNKRAVVVVYILVNQGE